MRMSWSAVATRAFVVWCFCFYVLVTLSSLDRRLQGDDHAVIWTSTSIRFGGSFSKVRISSRARNDGSR